MERRIYRSRHGLLMSLVRGAAGCGVHEASPYDTVRAHSTRQSGVCHKVEASPERNAALSCACHRAYAPVISRLDEKVTDILTTQPKRQAGFQARAHQLLPLHLQLCRGVQTSTHSDIIAPTTGWELHCDVALMHVAGTRLCCTAALGSALGPACHVGSCHPHPCSQMAVLPASLPLSASLSAAVSREQQHECARLPEAGVTALRLWTGLDCPVFGSVQLNDSAQLWLIRRSRRSTSSPGDRVSDLAVIHVFSHALAALLTPRSQPTSLAVSPAPCILPALHISHCPSHWGALLAPGMACAPCAPLKDHAEVEGLLHAGHGQGPDLKGMTTWPCSKEDAGS